MAIPKYDRLTALKMIHAFVPISRFNKGEAGKIIEEVKADGIRVIVKNNEPECVMISVEDYNDLSAMAKRSAALPTKAEEERRKAFIQRIRQNVPPPIPPSRKLKDVIKEIGSIDIDEDAVNELRRISMI